ncbi:arylsulfatase [Kaistia geumhonensis]|uniref:Arylsulfatase A-like enzyme n=1 Tax=Kaistia geumhonensis TaxID=410839 RepID=A0ABU0M5E3_9HYPH|nr:arylsulfatase [Kaistia geumhonensis]MCX5478595.1 arylsulfatase [Kaistia geumhonensis]MDQ0516187.1 arylsulfatase A-like enzyme [Kaistia geumhonensis]
MSHLLRRIAIAALAIAASATVGLAAERAPNIVYIVADDLGYADVGFHGSEIRTPSIDELAAGGARMEQFYAQPMCTPTRAALMTGRYPLRYGLQSFVILPDQTYGIPTDEKLLPQVLKSAGYDTAIIGKWHLGHANEALLPNARGFDYQYGPLIGEIDYYTHEVHGVPDWYRDGKPLDEKGYSTTLIGEEAVRYIDSRSPEKPFFLYLAFNAPHTPLQAPEADVETYKDIADPNRRTYAAMVSAMDRQIGDVLAALDRKGLRDNTIIVFQSDNGGVRNALFAGEGTGPKGELPASNAPFRDGKGSLYEGGTRVVALANWPGHIKAGEVDGPIHVVDMLPTLARQAGASTDGTKPLDGIDQWQAISTGAPSPRSEVVYNVEMFRGAVRDGDWKLVWNTPLPARIELFDIARDPGEKTNLAAANPEIVAKLQARIQQLAAEMKPSQFFEATFKSYLGRDAGDPVLPNTEAYYDQFD